MQNKKTLLFATSNAHKLAEIKAILPQELYALVGLEDMGIFEEIPETGNTLEENAYQKAAYLFNITGTPSLSEDTGLEVEALNNEPGVHSARYAGDEKNAQKNMDKLLFNLQNIENRKARFRTVICLVDKGKSLYFEGIINGKIAEYKSGTGGFGYDPIFIPNGYNQSFGEIDSSIKSKISHRALALKKMMDYFSFSDK